MMPEPVDAPRHHADCCLSISQDLLACLAKLVRDVAEESHRRREVILLSVGCGTGYFEAVLTAYLHEQGLTRTRVEGVEVVSADAKHLPKELVHRVPGTRSLCERARAADMLLFVYPRDGELVRRYSTQFADSIRTVLWLGPRAEWLVQQQLLHNVETLVGPVILESAGIAPYEVAVAYRNRAGVAVCESDKVQAVGEPSALSIDSI